jgi:hypothetical protein
MNSEAERVCPSCGSSAAGSSYCENCGCHLAEQSELPTRAAWTVAKSHPQNDAESGEGSGPAEPAVAGRSEPLSSVATALHARLTTTRARSMSGPVSELLREFAIPLLDPEGAARINDALLEAGLRTQPRLTSELQPTTQIRVFVNTKATPLTVRQASPVREQTPDDVASDSDGGASSPEESRESASAARAATALRDLMTSARKPSMSGPMSELLREFGLVALDEEALSRINSALTAAGLQVRPTLTTHLQPTTKVRIFPRASATAAPGARAGDASPRASTPAHAGPQKSAGLSNLQAVGAIGGVAATAAVAVVAGIILSSVFDSKAAVCNAAIDFGAHGVGVLAHCTLYTTLATIGHVARIMGAVVLALCALGAVILGWESIASGNKQPPA